MASIRKPGVSRRLATTSDDEPEAPGRLMLPALSAAAFLAALNFFAPTPFFPLIARDLQTTVPLLGQMVTLMVLVSAALGLVVGPLADRYGYRWPLVIGILAIAANLLGIAFSPAYPVLLAWSLVGGLGDALVFALPLAIAGIRFAGDARRRAIGLIIGSLSTAPIVGAPLLTVISGVGGWRIALAVA
ncbi:MAG TPA: MFS transporter, partial [Thermomicrobiales bacterium]|nr:MFS transporter [Thermomicrobiales bacterium]